jgi:4-amino-4-deoxy-L-arabinose transferase-like glycosyltransferase
VISLRRFDGAAVVVLAAILGLAAALRLVGIRYGLPYPFLNSDEANIVPRAFAIGHGHGLDPHWYDYPSGLMYVLAPMEALAHAPSYGAARAVAVILGVAGVAATWWLGERAYGRRAAIVGAATVAVATTHVAYSRMAVTDVPLTLAITCALALMLSERLEWAGLVVGLAAGLKYPGAIALIPLAAAGFGRWRRLASAAALAVVGFVIATPFVVVHAHTAWRSISHVNRLARAGWLGFEHDSPAPITYLDRLWQGLGPVFALGIVGLGVALWRRRRADLVVASFVLAYWLTLMPQRAHFDRYVLPLVPVLGVLAARIPWTAPLALVLLIVPLIWSIGEARQLTRTDTRLAAIPLIAAAVPASAEVAIDPSSPPVGHVRGVLGLQLPGPGRPSDPNRDVARLRRLGIHYVLVTGSVTDRVLRASDRYPSETRFYEALDRLHPLVDVEPGGHLVGPWVRLYRI